MTAWLHERGMAWLEVARDIIPAHRRTEITSHLEALRELGPIPAVPCHLDFTPGNLLRDDHGSLRLIDFEHARYDLGARDLVRLATRVWKHRPNLQEAFQTTYGSLTDVDRRVINHCRHLDDLTRTARARDPERDRWPRGSAAYGSSEIELGSTAASAPRMRTGDGAAGQERGV